MTPKSIAPPLNPYSAAESMAPPSRAAAAKGKAKGKRKGRGNAQPKAQAKETPKPKPGPSCELCHGIISEPGTVSEPGTAETSLHKVPLTICCHSCACMRRFIDDDGRLLACQTRAMQEFKLSRDDLSILEYTTKRSPFVWEKPYKLFIRAECEVGVHARY